MPVTLTINGAKVTAPDGTCLPLRLLTQQEAELLAETLNQYLDESEEE